MEDRDARIEKKIDRLSEDMTEVKTILAAQHEQIKIHIKRTDLLEKTLSLHREKDDSRHRELDSFVSSAKGAFRLLTVMSVFLGIVLAVREIIGKL